MQTKQMIHQKYPTERTYIYLFVYIYTMNRKTQDAVLVLPVLVFYFIVDKLRINKQI